MTISCPHCQAPMDMSDDSPATDTTCPSCGQAVSRTALSTLVPTGPQVMRVVGRFECHQLLGQGAFGEVWRARDRELGVDRAVKIPRPGVLGGPDDEKRFLREARAAASLKHAGIITVHEVGHDDESNTAYIVSDYIRGVNLAEWLTGRRPEFREAAELAAEIADALDFAHHHGVIHRDLKPGNIMLESRDEPPPSGAGTKTGSTVEAKAGSTVDDARPGAESQTGRARLLPSRTRLRPVIMDFGLARHDSAEASTITQEGGAFGTVGYMSPEQGEGHAHSVDARSDVYSLGVILFEMLTGERPFRGVPRMVLHQLLNDDPPPPRRLNNQIPRDLETITLKCLEKEPAKRYMTAADLAAELRRWLVGEPIRARPIRRPERLWRWAKRNPRVAVLTGTVALLLVAVSIGSSIMAVMAEQHRRFAEQAANTERDLRTAADQANTQLAEANTNLKQANASERAAKQDADQKRIDAEMARDESNAVQEFFQSKVLAAARPKGQDGGLGYDATIRDAIDAAEPQIGPAFHDKPLVEASIRDVLGATYNLLHEPELAIRQFERSRQLRSERLGPDHPDTLDVMNGMAIAYLAAGKIDEAVRLHEQTLEKRKVVLGQDHRGTLVSMNNLAHSYLAAGQFDRALSLYEPTLRTMRAILGSDDANTLAAMNGLGTVYFSLRKLDQAVPLFEETLERRNTMLGPDHPETLQSMDNLATAYHTAGKLDQALPLYERALEKWKVRLGPNHPDTLICMDNLASAYAATGKLDQAIPLYKETLEKLKARVGPDHPETLISINNLACAYEDAGKLDLALPLFKQLLEKRKAKLGPDHPDTLISINNLASAYRTAGRLDDAGPLFREAVEGARRKLGFGHPKTQSYSRNLADCYAKLRQPEKAEPLWRELAAFWKEKTGADSLEYAGQLASIGLNLLEQQKPAEAEAILRECLLIQEKSMPDDPLPFFSKSLLGGALAGQKKFQEAEPLLVEGYSGMKAREAKIPPAAKPRLAEAIRRLVDLYTAWEKPEQAAEWQKKLDEAVRSEAKPADKSPNPKP